MNTKDFELIAATFTDGYGIVADNKGDVYLVKPPFDFYGKEHLPYEQIEQTIHHFGFVKLQEPYHSWQEILQRLRQIAWDARQQAGDTRPSKITNDDRKAFFSTMPEAFLISPIEKMEEFLQTNKLAQVIFIGDALLENPNLTGDFRKRVEQVLQQTKNKQSITLSKFPHAYIDKNKAHFTPTFGSVAA